MTHRSELGWRLAELRSAQYQRRRAPFSPRRRSVVVGFLRTTVTAKRPAEWTSAPVAVGAPGDSFTLSGTPPSTRLKGSRFLVDTSTMRRGGPAPALLDLSEDFDRRARMVLEQGTATPRAVGCPRP